ncbi:MAG: tetratricopeptide repeat protein [Bacteroidetes bacterium]|jgi:tetratricopeptide (TPR) repeat protein|nr:tetratricopeptide repeat protein [Bacteroidota bacterium]
MTTRLVILLLALLLGADDGTDEGRRGNALYEAGDYEAAASAYRAGLDQHDGSEGAVYAALWNNLGLALHRQEKYEEADSAFQRAAVAATTPERQARALYNAGNNAVAQDQLESALALYRQALITDESHADARFNYEYLKRQMAQRQQQSSSATDPIEPSAFARQLKRRADEMATNRQYEDAYRLMQNGLQQDSTVAAFRSFITRLSDVAQIDSLNS